MKLTTAILVCATLLFSSLIHAEDRFANVELATQKVNGNIYMLYGVNGFAGGNIGVSIGQDGTLIVDDQFKPMAKKIKESIKEIGGSDLQYVLNTHWHGDHTQGNIVFGPVATVISHENVRKRHQSTQKNDFGVTPPAPESALADITFTDSLSIYFNGEEIRMFHLPGGHTDGDGIVHFTESNVVHLGDLYFARTFPFIDLNTGGNALGFERNIATLLKMLPEDIKIIPGHGPLSTKDDLRNYHKMLTTTIQLVKDKASAGKSLETIQKEGLGAEWDSWGGGFIKPAKWIEIIHRSL